MGIRALASLPNLSSLPASHMALYSSMLAIKVSILSSGTPMALASSSSVSHLKILDIMRSATKQLRMDCSSLEQGRASMSSIRS